MTINNETIKEAGGAVAVAAAAILLGALYLAATPDQMSGEYDLAAAATAEFAAAHGGGAQ